MSFLTATHVVWVPWHYGIARPLVAGGGKAHRYGE